MNKSSAMILLALFLSGCIGLSMSSSGTPLAGSEIIQQKKPFVLTLLSTADLQGLMEPSPAKWDFDGDGDAEERLCGGFARIAGTVDAIRSSSAGPVILVSTGDDLMGRVFHHYHGEALIDLMNLSKYSILALGNHEFDGGIKALANALKQAHFTVLASDLDLENTPLETICHSDHIITHNGVTIGFFSLMTEEFPLVTSVEIPLKSGNIEFAQRKVQSLRARDVDVVVACTHIGFKHDKILAKAVPGIDVIIGGHSHDTLPDRVRVGDTLIVNAGEKGSMLVRLDLPITATGIADPEHARYTIIPLDDHVLESAAVATRVAEYQSGLPASVVIGRTEKSWDLTKTALRNGESGVADMINDLIRKKFEVDIVLQNAGSLRGKKMYPPGDVTDEMLSEIDEFRSYIYLVNIKGKHLKAILERSAAGYDSGALLQVSGIRYEMDLSRQAQVLEFDGSSRVSGVKTPGDRVTAIAFKDGSGWKTVDPDRVYRVAVNSFLVENAGDGYFWFRDYGSDVRNTMSTLYSVMAEWVTRAGVLNPQEPDGRLVIKGMEQ